VTPCIEDSKLASSSDGQSCSLVRSNRISNNCHTSYLNRHRIFRRTRRWGRDAVAGNCHPKHTSPDVASIFRTEKRLVARYWCSKVPTASIFRTEQQTDLLTEDSKLASSSDGQSCSLVRSNRISNNCHTSYLNRHRIFRRTRRWGRDAVAGNCHPKHTSLDVTATLTQYTTISRTFVQWTKSFSQVIAGFWEIRGSEADNALLFNSWSCYKKLISRRQGKLWPVITTQWPAIRWQLRFQRPGVLLLSGARANFSAVVPLVRRSELHAAGKAVLVEC